MRPRRPTGKSDSPRPRAALHRIAALSVALLVVASGVFGVVGFGASAVLQEAGNDSTSITLGERYDEAVHENDTTDAFTFEASQGDYVRIGSYNPAGEGIGATVYGPSGQQLDEFDPFVEWLLDGFVAPESGEYRVVFEDNVGYPESDALDYTFEVNAVSPDEYEPNDAMSSAATLSGSTTVDAELGQGEEDWYAVEAAEGTDILADLDPDEYNLDQSYTVELLDAEGNVLDESSSTCTPGGGTCDPAGLSATAPADGTYYIHVSPGRDGIRGYDAYELSTSFQQPSDGASDDPTSATKGTEIEGTVSTDDTSDVYTFDAARNDYIRISALAGTPDVMRATVYGPSGDRVTSGELGPDTVLVGGKAGDAGEYKVEFTYTGSVPAEDGQSYSFEVETADADSYEANGAPRFATAISSGTTDANLNHDSDEDYYAVSAAAGSTLSASLDKENLITNGFTFQLLDSDENVLAEDSVRCTPGTRCTLDDLSTTVSSDGTYYVRVTGDVTGFNDYSLTVDAQPPAEDSETPDDTTDSPEETETPDDTTDTPDETTEVPDDSTESDDGDSGDDGTTTPDESTETDGSETSDGSDDAEDSSDDADSGEDSSVDDESDSSDTEDSGTDDSADSSDGTDGSNADDGSDSSDTTSDESADDGSADDSSQSAATDTDTDASTGGDASDTSGDSDSSADDGSSDSSSEDSNSPTDESTDDSDTANDESDDTDQSTDDADSTTESSESSDTDTPTETGDDGTPTDDGTAVTTTDGEEAAAGPSAPVNNSSNSSGFVVGDGTETESSSGFGPGFGVVTALVALLAVALLARRAQ